MFNVHYTCYNVTCLKYDQKKTKEENRIRSNRKQLGKNMTGTEEKTSGMSNAISFNHQTMATLLM